MALNLPNKGDSILAYDTEQTNEINKMVDYVVEIGSNANGSWEKWNSGKLVQRGRYAIQNINIDYVVPIPIAFVDTDTNNINVIGNISRPGGYNNFYSLLKGIGADKKSFIVRAEMTTGTTTNFPFHWEATGRWK